MRIKHHVEHHHARARGEQTIKQKRPYFARPWERLLGHQLKCAVARNFFSGQRRQLQCALIDPEENKIRWRRRLPSFASNQVLKALFTSPRRGNKWGARKKMTGKNQGRPKNANQSEDQETMTPEPMHVRA